VIIVDIFVTMHIKTEPCSSAKSVTL